MDVVMPCCAAHIGQSGTPLKAAAIKWHKAVIDVAPRLTAALATLKFQALIDSTAGCPSIRNCAADFQIRPDCTSWLVG